MQGKPTEKPILFSTMMVRAIIEGRKTQTRRVFKPKTLKYRDYLIAYGVTSSFVQMYLTRRYGPYKKGQILWVRETWRNTGREGHEPEYCYRANMQEQHDNSYDVAKWKPSIFMPKKAARLFLRVKKVCMAQIQDISSDDIIAEGIRDIPPNEYRDQILRKSFSELWDLINKKRGYGWDVNPWVWVIKFEKSS